MEKAYRVEEVADLLGVCKETIRAWVRKGKLQAIADSRKNGYLVKASDLKNFLEDNPIYYSDRVYFSLNIRNSTSNIDNCIEEVEKTIEVLTRELNRLKIIKGWLKGEKK